MLSYLLLGLLPLTALPFLGHEPADGPEPTEDTDTEARENSVDLLAEVAPWDAIVTADDTMAGPATAPPRADADFAEEGEHYRFGAEPGDAVLNAFEPGYDAVSIDLCAGTDDVQFESDVDEEGATLSILLGDAGQLRLSFPGLDDVPGDDIILRLRDESTGAPYELALTDATEALDPVDPDTADAPGPVDTGPALDPVDPATADSPGPAATDPVLDPVDPDDADVAATAEQPDRWSGPLVLGGRDSTEGVVQISRGWAEEDELPGPVWVAEGQPPAEFTEFEPGQDILHLSVETDDITSEPSVTVKPTEDGADSLVSVNGKLVAVLRGTALATADDIHAEAIPLHGWRGLAA